MRYNLPPLTSLPAFEAVARRKSFTKAAEELCLTQAAISFQVRNLEKSLGVELFERHHRALELTRAGEDLRNAVQEAFTRLEIEKAAITGRKPKHSFTISAPVSFCSKWLVPRLQRLHEDIPAIMLLIDANDSLLDLDDGSIDLAIRYAAPEPDDTDRQLMLEDTVFPVCSPAIQETLGRGLVLDNLAQIPLLHDQMLDVTWSDWLKAAGATEPAPSRGMSFSHTGHAIDAAISGRGLALGRLPLVADDLANGRLVQPFEGVRPSEYAYSLIRSHQPRPNKGLDRIVSWLLSQAQITTRHFAN
jgi:LysR family transcriptional regulator, glycine cleavage system transcriptional activator